MHKHAAYTICRSYVKQFVVIQTRDGRSHHGIIEKVDNEHVYLLKAHGDGYRGAKEKTSRSGGDTRLYGYGGYPGYGYYGYPYGYGYGGFARVAIPLSFITGLALGGLFW